MMDAERIIQARSYKLQRRLHVHPPMSDYRPGSTRMRVFPHNLNTLKYVYMSQVLVTLVTGELCILNRSLER